MPVPPDRHTKQSHILIIPDDVKNCTTEVSNKKINISILFYYSKGMHIIIKS